MNSHPTMDMIINCLCVVCSMNMKDVYILTGHTSTITNRSSYPSISLIADWVLLSKVGSSAITINCQGKLEDMSNYTLMFFEFNNERELVQEVDKVNDYLVQMNAPTIRLDHIALTVYDIYVIKAGYV